MRGQQRGHRFVGFGQRVEVRVDARRFVWKRCSQRLLQFCRRRRKRKAELGKAQPVVGAAKRRHLDAAAGQSIEQPAVQATLVEPAEVVNADVEREAVAFESLGQATGAVVTFKHQHALADMRQCCPGAQTADAGTDDDCVVLHAALLLLAQAPRARLAASEQRASGGV